MKKLTPLRFVFAKNILIVSTLFLTFAAAVNELQFDGGNFVVTWNYLHASQEIEFEVRVKTTGYVALGLTKTNSGMQNLDLFAGGVNSTGTRYLKDYYATGMGGPPVDSQQDYTLISASELNGVTTVRCKRKLNTNDNKDLLIQPGDAVYIAWAYHTSSDNFIRHSFRDYSSKMHVLIPMLTTSSPSSSTVGPTSETTSSPTTVAIVSTSTASASTSSFTPSSFSSSSASLSTSPSLSSPPSPSPSPKTTKTTTAAMTSSIGIQFPTTTTATNSTNTNTKGNTSSTTQKPMPTTTGAVSMATYSVMMIILSLVCTLIVY